jgi:NADH:ubiquinone oxidoreductase subunit 6 (subunit J)
MFHAIDPILGPLFFWAFTTIAVLCSLGLLISRHPLFGAINLIGVMLSLSGLYALMNSPFLAVLQVLVYAGAIMVLVVFVIMVLNQAKDHKVPYLDWKALIALPLPLMLGLALFQVLVSGHTDDDKAATAFRMDDAKTGPAFTAGTLIEAPFAKSSTLTAVFRARDVGPDHEYLWDFGDKESANGRELAHTYKKPGRYDVQLKVSRVVPVSPAEYQAAKAARERKEREFRDYMKALKEHKNPGGAIPHLPTFESPVAAMPVVPEFTAGVQFQVANVIRADVTTVAATMFDTSAAGPGYYLLFEIIGVLLLAAVVAAVVLAKRTLMSAISDSDDHAEPNGAEGHH